MKSVEMTNKYEMSALINVEQSQHVWDETFFGYPLWIHFREDLIKGGIKADRRIKKPSLFQMLKSMRQTLFFLLFEQQRKPKTYFLMERAELLEVYRNDPSENKVLFLNFEQGHGYDGVFISADFFNLIRYISRKCTFVFVYFSYRHSVDFFSNGLLDRAVVKTNVQNAMGDAFFLFILSKLLRQDYRKCYSGCIIPIGEKFLNRLNSIEVQHGIIHKEHVGYIGIPSVKNDLMLYHEKYKTILIENGYVGNLFVDSYKKIFFERKSSRYFPIVIYTQPLKEMQDKLKKFLTNYRGEMDIYIQKHPKDYVNYPLDKQYIVHATTPNEVGFPVFYTSSVIENFTLANRNCYIWKLSAVINMDDVLEIFLKGSSSNVYISEDIEVLVKTIDSHRVKMMKVAL